MKIAIIGGGFTGLAAAYYLTKKGHTATIFEKDAKPGGLAIGYAEKGWQWTLESHYHHWFTNDENILNLAKEIGYPVLTKRPKTSVYIKGEILQLDSPFKVLALKNLTLLERLRMAAVLGLLRYNPIWQPLEKYPASKILKKTMGDKPYELLWEPQLHNKFGEYINKISLAWFWARIKKRTSSLAYPQGGFLQFAKALAKNIKQKNGEIFFETSVIDITSQNNKVLVKYQIQNTKYKILEFDKVIVTVSSLLFLKIAPTLPNEYQTKLKKLKGLGAINLILRLNKQFLKDNTYWLSICKKNAPIMAIVEHTNFIGKKNYNNEHIVYLGNYLPHDHRYFKMSKEDILKEFDPFLKEINPEYKKTIIDFEVFKAPFAQPIIPTNYSKIIPPLKTPLKNVYLANIQQVYPWDRGTNYAVELGMKVAKLLESD